MGHRCNAGVGGQVRRRGERRTAADLEHPLDIVGDALTLLQNFFQRICQFRQGDLGGVAARHRHRLGIERGQDLLDQSDSHPRCACGRKGGEPAFAGPADTDRAASNRLSDPCTATSTWTDTG